MSKHTATLLAEPTESDLSRENCMNRTIFVKCEIRHLNCCTIYCMRRRLSHFKSTKIYYLRFASNPVIVEMIPIYRMQSNYLMSCQLKFKNMCAQ